jgi:hypothetical protein
LAVFGMALDRPIVADSVSRVRDHAYVEAKVEAELLFRRLCKARGLSLEIVRFGNIWGAGSGAWAVPLVHRLVTGRPVGVVGAPGYSNATDVANAAAYLSFLLQSEPSDEIRYHHVAELSHVRWSELLRPLAAMIGVDPVYAEPSVLDVPSSGLGEVSASLAAAHPRTVFKRLGDERVLGSWTRTVKRRFPARMRRRLQGVRVVHAQAEDVARLEQTILGILSGAHRFDPVVEPEWTPPITQDASVSAVMEWLDWNSRP